MVLSISCDTSSNSYSSKNTVNIDESKIKSIKIGGNFIAYLTIDGQVTLHGNSKYSILIVIIFLSNLDTMLIIFVQISPFAKNFNSSVQHTDSMLDLSIVSGKQTITIATADTILNLNLQLNES